MRELLRHKYFLITVDEARRLVRIHRSSEKFNSLDEVHATFPVVQAALQSINRAAHSVLLDLRDGPLRSDPEFDRAMEPYRNQLTEGFARGAILVRTAVGMLQVQRHARQDGAHASIFNDENEALAFALGKGGGARP